jgi:hypothetical protein
MIKFKGEIMMYELFIPQSIKMLKNLQLLLNKSEDFSIIKKFEFDVLLNSRLAPDQFPLSRQIQIACDTAKLCAARMSQTEAPVHSDTEKTIVEFRTRINEVIAFLEKINPESFNQGTERHITQPRWEGKYLTGAEYLTQHAIPNLYFHITTAYAILRHNGVDLGKKDYLGEMPFKK